MKKITSLIALLSVLPASIQSKTDITNISYTDAFYTDMKTKKDNPSVSTIQEQVKTLAQQYGINTLDKNKSSFLQQAISTGNSSLVSFVVNTLKAKPSKADLKYVDWAWNEHGKKGTEAVQSNWKNIYKTVTGENPPTK